MKRQSAIYKESSDLLNSLSTKPKISTLLAKSDPHELLKEKIFSLVENHLGKSDDVYLENTLESASNEEISYKVEMKTTSYRAYDYNLEIRITCADALWIKKFHIINNEETRKYYDEDLRKKASPGKSSKKSANDLSEKIGYTNKGTPVWIIDANAKYGSIWNKITDIQIMAAFLYVDSHSRIKSPVMKVKKNTPSSRSSSPYSNLTVSDLRRYASVKQIRGYSSMRKNELLSALYHL